MWHGSIAVQLWLLVTHQQREITRDVDKDVTVTTESSGNILIEATNETALASCFAKRDFDFFDLGGFEDLLKKVEGLTFTGAKVKEYGDQMVTRVAVNGVRMFDVMHELKLKKDFSEEEMQAMRPGEYGYIPDVANSGALSNSLTILVNGRAYFQCYIMKQAHLIANYEQILKHDCHSYGLIARNMSHWSKASSKWCKWIRNLRNLTCMSQTKLEVQYKAPLQPLNRDAHNTETKTSAVAAPAGPKDAATSSASLYVGGLLPDITEAHLCDFFNQVGPVQSIRVCRHAITRRPLGYAYVNFRLMSDAERALDTMNYSILRGQKIRIVWQERNASLRKSNKGNVIIKNLHHSIGDKILHNTFAICGEIYSCKIA